MGVGPTINTGIFWDLQAAWLGLDVTYQMEFFKSPDGLLPAFSFKFSLTSSGFIDGLKGSIKDKVNGSLDKFQTLCDPIPIVKPICAAATSCVKLLLGFLVAALFDIFSLEHFKVDVPDLAGIATGGAWPSFSIAFKLLGFSFALSLNLGAMAGALKNVLLAGLNACAAFLTKLWEAIKTWFSDIASKVSIVIASCELLTCGVKEYNHAQDNVDWLGNCPTCGVATSKKCAHSTCGYEKCKDPKCGCATCPNSSCGWVKPTYHWKQDVRDWAGFCYYCGEAGRRLGDATTSSGGPAVALAPKAALQDPELAAASAPEPVEEAARERRSLREVSADAPEPQHQAADAAGPTTPAQHVQRALRELPNGDPVSDAMLVQREAIDGKEWGNRRLWGWAAGAVQTIATGKAFSDSRRRRTFYDRRRRRRTGYDRRRRGCPVGHYEQNWNCYGCPNGRYETRGTEVNGAGRFYSGSCTWCDGAGGDGTHRRRRTANECTPQRRRRTTYTRRRRTFYNRRRRVCASCNVPIASNQKTAGYYRTCQDRQVLGICATCGWNSCEASLCGSRTCTTPIWKTSHHCVYAGGGTQASTGCASSCGAETCKSCKSHWWGPKSYHSCQDIFCGLTFSSAA